jgi:putative ABC transport system permease protein
MRQRRAGDLKVVIAALAVAVAALVSVMSFADRLQRALKFQGSELLAADLVVRSPYPSKSEWTAEISRLGLLSARTVSFRSVVMHGDDSHLAEVKAVEEGYPLRGRLRVAADIDLEDAQTTGIPPLGNVWVDGQLMALLNTTVGGRIRLGSRQFVIDKVVTLEPDRGGAVFAIAPRLILNVADLPSTGLIQPGSLASYRLLIAGDVSLINTFRDWMRKREEVGAVLQDASNAQPRFRTALDKGEQFLGLATLVSMLLAGVAIARAARNYAQRHLDTVALMRCVGATQRKILQVFMTQFLVLGTAGSIIGCAVGYAAQQVFVYLVPGLVAGDLPWPSLMPAVVGLLAGVVTLVGFAAPIILRLRGVPPLRVLRRELGALPNHIAAVYITAMLAVAALVLWVGRDWILASYVLGASLITIILLAALSYLLIQLVSRMRQGVGVSWRFGIAALARRAGSSTGQIVAIGIGVMAILLLTLVRTDLLQAWRTSLPPETPNHFLINIQPGQLTDIERFFREQRWPKPALRPIVRARLIAINDKLVRPQDFRDAFAQRVTQRAANLSWMETLQSDNKLVAGSWWRVHERASPLVSVEQQYAEALELRLGDKLKYRIADQEITVTVSNLRAVAWDSFRPNFFLLVPPALLSGYPTSYITSLYVPRSRAYQLSALIKKFPNVTNIDVDALLQQVRRLIDRVNSVLEYIFLFTVLAGIVVLYAAIQTTQGERRQEVAILRTLGATRRQLSIGMVSEFVVMGALAGGVGALAAMMTGYAISEYLLSIPYRLHIRTWLVGVGAAATIVTAAGILGTYRLWRTPPWHILREN